MITAAKIHKDIARIEALMMLGSKREKSLLATIRHQCYHCLNLIRDCSDEVLDKQHELATKRLNNYDLAIDSIRQRRRANNIWSDVKQKELEAEVVKYYKPDRLRHQIRFFNYILGHAEIISEDLLTSMKAVSQTEKHHAKQKGSNQ